MSQTTTPSFALCYWRPWESDSNIINSYCDYLKDVSLVNYGANVMSAKIQEVANTIGYKLDELTLEQRQTNRELMALNRRMDMVIEQQKITNLLLQDIAQVLRVPEYEKERIAKINLGLKFFVNGAKDEDLYKDALNNLLEAETLCPTDYFVLHRIGCIYLYVPSLINMEKAVDYLSKAAKYAIVESDPNASRLMNVLVDKDSSYYRNTFEPDTIKLLAADSYSKCAFAYYVLGNYELSLKNQIAAVKCVPDAKNYYNLAKYYARNNQVENAIQALQNCYYISSGIARECIFDPDFISHSQLIDVLTKCHKEIVERCIEKINLEADPIVKQSFEWARDNMDESEYLDAVYHFKVLPSEKPFFQFSPYSAELFGFDNLSYYVVSYEDFSKDHYRSQALCDSTGKMILSTVQSIQALTNETFIVEMHDPDFKRLEHGIDEYVLVDKDGKVLSIHSTLEDAKGINEIIPAIKLNFENFCDYLFIEGLFLESPDEGHRYEYKYFSVRQIKNGKEYCGVYSRDYGLIIPCEYNTAIWSPDFIEKENPNKLIIKMRELLLENTMITPVYQRFEHQYKSALGRTEKVLQTSSNGKKEGCYIATCVYGSYDCAEVWALRRFRDNTLNETYLGRLFIKTYYAISPTIVKLFGGSKVFRTLCKMPLDKFVSKLLQKGYSSMPYSDK